MLRDIYQKGDISPRITNIVLSDILSMDSIIGTQNKIFAYCYLGVLSYLYYNRKYESFNISVKEIKRFLGYSEINKTVDYMIKKNGILYQAEYINDAENPISNKVKNRIKIPNVLNEMEKCHTFNVKLFMDCVENKSIGLSGFFVANYINEFYKDYNYGERGSIISISRQLNIPESTITLYLEALFGAKLINKVDNHKEYLKDLNIYLRSKLNKWRENSISINNKCVITNDNRNIIIHHTIPFNQIRDFALNYTGIEVKPFEEYSKQELLELERVVNEYHNLNIGVPLRKDVHIKFHRTYGNKTTIEDLLEFKHNYTQNK